MLKWLTGVGPLWIYLAIFLGGAVSGGAGVHSIDSHYYGEKIQEGKVQLAETKMKQEGEMRELAEEQQRQLAALALDLQNKQHNLAALDAKHTQEMKNAQDENNRLRHLVDIGAVRLRVAVQAADRHDVCSAAADQTPGTASVDDGTVELAPSARQAYFDLRDSITKDKAKLDGLQDYVKNVCQPAQ